MSKATQPWQLSFTTTACPDGPANASSTTNRSSRTGGWLAGRPSFDGAPVTTHPSTTASPYGFRRPLSCRPVRPPHPVLTVHHHHRNRRPVLRRRARHAPGRGARPTGRPATRDTARRGRWHPVHRIPARILRQRTIMSLDPPGDLAHDFAHVELEDVGGLQGVAAWVRLVLKHRRAVEPVVRHALFPNQTPESRIPSVAAAMEYWVASSKARKTGGEEAPRRAAPGCARAFRRSSLAYLDRGLRPVGQRVLDGLPRYGALPAPVAGPARRQRNGNLRKMVADRRSARPLRRITRCRSASVHQGAPESRWRSPGGTVELANPLATSPRSGLLHEVVASQDVTYLHSRTICLKSVFVSWGGCVE